MTDTIMPANYFEPIIQLIRSMTCAPGMDCVTIEIDVSNIMVDPVIATSYFTDTSVILMERIHHQLHVQILKGTFKDYATGKMVYDMWMEDYKFIICVTPTDFKKESAEEAAERLFW